MSIETKVKEHNLPNGLPPHFSKLNIMATPAHFNGINSSESSRTASPADRLTYIPASQLPPPRSATVAPQLPQNSNVPQLTQNYSHLSITPTASPSKQNFKTSTPVLTHTKQDCSEQSIQATISPIGTDGSTQFTHSTQSHFTSFVSNVNTQTRDVPNVTNVPLGSENQMISSQYKFPPQNVLINTKVDADLKQNQNDYRQPHDKPIIGIFPQKPSSGNVTTVHNMHDMHSLPPVNNTVQQNLGALSFSQRQQQFSIRPMQSSTSMSNLSQNPVSVPSTKLLLPSTNLNTAHTYNLATSNVQPGSANPLGHFTRPPLPSSNLYVTQTHNVVTSNVTSNTTNTKQSSSQNIPPYLSVQKQMPPQSSNSLASHFSSGLVPQERRIQQPPIIHTNAPPTMNTAQVPKTHVNRYPTISHSSMPNVQFQSTPLPQSQLHFNTYQNQDQLARSYIADNNQQQYIKPNIVNSGFDTVWGYETCDLLQCTNVLPPTKVELPQINLGQAFHDSSNCSLDIFRCTMTKIPDTNSLLQKSRLPLGVLIHPFKDLDHLPVIQCSTIVRCRACRTYINPFVYFVDTKKWKCNLCYRINELPEEFQYDPVSKTYGDPSRRPEIKSSTIEYIAPSEYMLRPPQPAVYLFLLDVSHAAIESGYLHIFCDVLTSSLTNLPGDARLQVGFIAFNSALHFYSLAEGLTQPHEMTVLDIDDIFLPCPDNLIVNLHERKELIADLLVQLPTRFSSSFDTGSALGTALQAAYKMISSTGGRITVFQATLPAVGPGALMPREDPSQRAGAEVHHLNPVNDFYKRLALDCSGQQIAVDLFVVNSQYVDLATLSGISRFSGGCIHHFPLFKTSHTLHAEKLKRCFKRYLTRKIGFEAVMRIRCSRGLSIHTFHGNFFVRSTDLLSLPNINPESGFGMQVAIEESLSDLSSISFQAALLYTSSKGERRIRVHTLCVPVASTLSDIINSADQQCIIGLLAKMAVDRSMMSSLSDAREAFINVAIDILSSYKLSLNLGSAPPGLLAPKCLKLLPIYISALLKHVAFRTGTSTRLDDRVKAMCDMKTLPLYMLIQQVYPDLYPVHNLEDQNSTLSVDGEAIPHPPHLQLTARCLDSKGAFLMDMGEQMVLLVCPNVSQTFLHETLGVPDYNSISEEMYELPVLSNLYNQRLNNFINSLNDEKPFVATLHIMKDNSPNRHMFIERLIEDRVENALSYHEFLQHLKTQVK